MAKQAISLLLDLSTTNHSPSTLRLQSSSILSSRLTPCRTLLVSSSCHISWRSAAQKSWCAFGPHAACSVIVLLISTSLSPGTPLSPRPANGSPSSRETHTPALRTLVPEHRRIPAFHQPCRSLQNNVIENRTVAYPAR